MNFDRHRFFVTGAAGFVGANLSRRLIDHGAEVHVLLKPSTPDWRLECLRDSLHVHMGDITDGETVDRVIHDVRPTVIYHLATHGAYHYQDDAEQILRINVLGLCNLMRACNRVGYELFINTGSSSEYGNKSFAMRETDILDPNSYYAVAKAAQTHLCRFLGRTEQGHSIVTLRLFSVYGPYEEPKRLIPNLTMAAIHDRRIEMASPQIARDFVHVDDVVDAYLRIEQLLQLGGEILNVGTGVQTSLGQLVETMAQVLGAPLRVEWGKAPARAWDTNLWVCDTSKARRLLGLVPSTSLQRGLADNLNWFREHGHFYTECRDN